MPLAELKKQGLPLVLRIPEQRRDQSDRSGETQNQSAFHEDAARGPEKKGKARAPDDHDAREFAQNRDHRARAEISESAHFRFTIVLESGAVPAGARDQKPRAPENHRP